MAEARAEIERTRTTLLAPRRTLGTLEGKSSSECPSSGAWRKTPIAKAGILELLDASRSFKDIHLLHVRQLEMTKRVEEDVIAAAGLDAQ